MEPNTHIVIIDDDEDYCALLGKMISSLGYPTSWTTDPSQVYSLLEKLDPSCIFLDLTFPQMDGIAVLKKIKTFRRKIPVIMLTGHESIKTAVIAIKEGALDYLTKPLETGELKAAITKALREVRVSKEVEKVKSYLGEVNSFGDFVELSEKVQEFIRLELGDAKEMDGKLPKSWSSSLNSIAIPRNISLQEASQLAVHHIEKQWILNTLEQTHWRRGEAARILGIDSKTLYRKMKDYGLEEKAAESASGT